MKELEYIEKLTAICERLLDIVDNFTKKDQNVHVEVSNSNHSHNVTTAETSQDNGSRRSEGAPIVQNDFGVRH